MAKSSRPHRSPSVTQRLRSHLKGIAVATFILAGTMAVVIGPYTSIGQYSSHQIHHLVAWVAPVTTEKGTADSHANAIAATLSHHRSAASGAHV